MVQPLWRTVWRFLKKLKIELPHDPVIPLLGIYLEKNMIRKDICTPMFTAALFTIATYNVIIDRYVLILIISDTQMTPPLWQKVKRNKEPLDEGERE